MTKNSSGFWHLASGGQPVSELFTGSREDDRPVSWFHLDAANVSLAEAADIGLWKKLPVDTSLELGNRHPALCMHQRTRKGIRRLGFQGLK